jgi:hypothetical protein
VDRQDLREVQTVVVSKAPRRRKVGESRVPSVAWKKGVARRWRVIVGSRAAKARPPHNLRREVAAVPAVPVVEVPAAVAVPAVAAAAEEDKEGRPCTPTHEKMRSGC